MDESLNTLTLLTIMLVIFPLARAYFARPQWEVKDITRSRIAFFDIVRGIAIAAVVGIHAVDFYRTALEIDSVPLLFMNAVLRFAIPLFLIASGMLLDPNELKMGIGAFYRRKIVRILVPYLVATAVYFVFTEPWSISELALHIVRGDILVPYYFVVVLFALYVMYPILVQLARYSWFLPSAFALSVSAALLNIRWFEGVPLPLEFIFFFAFGIAMRPYLLSDWVPKRAVWILFGVLYIAAFFASPAYYYNAMFFWGIAVFMLLFSIRAELEKYVSYLGILGKHSLWIFLIHYPFLFYIGEYMRAPIIELPNVLGAALLGVVSLASSFICSLVLEAAILSVKKLFKFART